MNDSAIIVLDPVNRDVINEGLPASLPPSRLLSLRSSTTPPRVRVWNERMQQVRVHAQCAG